MPDRERQNVMLMVNLRAGGVEQRVRVADISRGGLKVKARPCARLGERVLIELPGLGWIAATVAWVRIDIFGLQFHSQIDPAAARQPVTGTYVRPNTPPLP